MWQNSYDGSPSLYLVPTPIGNMEDITLRAIKTLKEVDVIFAEDTRVTLQLLNYFDIKNRVISLHNYNEYKVKDVVLDFLVNKKNVAIVTDRGTPLISDPGYKTVKYIKDNGIFDINTAMLLIQDYVENGLFIEQEKVYENTNIGKMNFKKTLDCCTPLYTKQGPIYLKYITNSKKVYNYIKYMIGGILYV